MKVQTVWFVHFPPVECNHWPLFIMAWYWHNAKV